MADHRAMLVGAFMAALVAGECAALGASQQSLPQPVMHRKQPAPPRWASEYQVSFTFEIPYIKRYQPEGLTYYYTVWQDEKHGRQRMERGTAEKRALETVIQTTGENVDYTLFPHKDKLACTTAAMDAGGGPTRQGDGLPAAPAAAGAAPELSAAARRRLLQAQAPVNKTELSFVLPEVTTDRWRYEGTASKRGHHADVWVLRLEPDEGYGTYHSNYTLYVTKGGKPLELNMWGINLYTGGHFDNYIASYYHYKPGKIAEAFFQRPDICPEKPPDVVESSPTSGWQHGLHAQIMSILPNRHYGDQEYDQHVHVHGRRHRSAAEYLRRRDHYYANKKFIEDWNADGSHGYELAMNHMGDVASEEHRAMLAGNRRARAAWAANPRQAPMAVHVPTVPFHLLPPTVDWRGSPADSLVKNQGACGSCWAFGAAGALEAAYYRATGKPTLFSEQMLVDCTWDLYEGELSNKGCYDGYQQLALKWVFEMNGGLATEADYPYIGVTNFCNTTGPMVEFKKGTVTRVKGFEDGLMEALLTKGPMTVSVDAGAESFRFYKRGIYNNTACHTVPVTDLDHAVLVSGYGTQGGQDYWIVKNTWSANWGEDGYIRIARQPADCGIATEPIYVDLELA